jgi:hypothetical protein
LICKLCKVERQLKKSHIIPEYFFRSYRPNDGSSLQEVKAGRYFTPRYPIGYYEQLLCEQCEAITAKWDDTGIKFLQNADLWEQKNLGDRSYYEIMNFEYSTLKLFFMSVLWRAAVSSFSFFSAVELGPFHARLSNLLLSADPGEPEDFAVSIFKYTSAEEELEKIIVSPTRFKPNRINHYRFRLNEFIFVIKVDSQPLKVSQYFFCLKKDKPLRIIESNFMDSQELANMIKVLARQSRINHPFQKMMI